MNRILFEPGELCGNRAVFGGVRAEHVLKVLHAGLGSPLKTGELDGLVGNSKIVRVDAAKPEIEVEFQHDEQPLPSWFDLVLAPPRPRVMKRLLPQLAALGVGTIVLVGAKKVEKDFWGATLLKAENYRPLLVDGLMQCGAAAVPRLEVRRNQKRFLADELDTLLPSANRLFAHPYAAQPVEAATRPGRLTLAVGPEGGWTEEEAELFAAHGFVAGSLGRRILRTDTAVIALVAKLNKENQ